MDNRPIIIKRIKKVQGHAHHGGAWKVAYADFVTAMMAFFLLMWLLNVTTDEQRKGIADYFSPASVSPQQSGSGGVLGGQTLIVDGSKISVDGVTSVTKDMAAQAQSESIPSESKPTAEEIAQKQAELEFKAFREAETAIKQAIQNDPAVAELSKHILVDMTPEGLRIQLIDQDRESMFATASSKMNDHARKLMQMIAKVAEKMPNQLAISGHTDALPYRANNEYGNWELSSDRANASRRAMLDAGIPAARFQVVTGRADLDPLIPTDPKNAANRRISIVLLNQKPPADAAAN
jgi:chemotaxis protein MotB